MRSSACKMLCYKISFKYLHLYYQLSLRQHTHFPGETSDLHSTWGVRVRCFACVHTHASAWLKSDVNTCLPRMPSHKGNKQVGKYNGAAG